MAAAITHAHSSVRRWGGVVEDYLPIHNWFDATKELVGDFRHRALRHHATGVVECEQRFGMEITLSTGRKIPTRWIAERHLIEDFGRIPTVQDWLRCIKPEPWMTAARQLHRELEQAAAHQYTVKKGDSLATVAKDVYGDASKWKQVYEANKDQVQNPDRIYPGQVLEIPG